MTDAPDPGSRAGGDPESGEVSRLLAAVRGGDESARDRLFELVYADLRAIAHRELSRRRGATLSTTALVHEVYLKLDRLGGWAPQDRGHFLALASRAMRQILVDAARTRLADKRGGAAARLPLDGNEIAVDVHAEELLAGHAALEKLAGSEPDLALLVEWRFFGGYSIEEIAAAKGVSGRTIKREWRTARAFLYRELGGEPGTPAADLS